MVWLILLLILLLVGLLVVYQKNPLFFSDFLDGFKPIVSNRRHLSEFPNPVFIESGSYKGDGIEEARRAGFEELHSVEIMEPLYERCRSRFKEDPRVHLYHGSTVDEFPNIIKNLKKRATFWLDGHYSLHVTGYDPKDYCPLMRELEAIRRHPIKTHTILIDDRRLMKASSNNGKDGLFGVTEEEVIFKLKEINPNYQIEYLDGSVKNDIIVAHLRNKFPDQNVPSNLSSSS